MLDLIEGAKIIHGRTSTALAASGYGDWINLENMHCVWAICSVSSSGTKTHNFQGYVSDSYAGATPARAVCQYWRTTGPHIDKMIASTQTTGLRTEVVGGTVVMRFDPASRSASSQQYFSVACATGEVPVSVIYITQPRYEGLGQILATSSST